MMNNSVGGFTNEEKMDHDCEWDEKLEFERPYYHSQRLSDFEKFRLQYTNPSPFKTRNVYFDLKVIERI